VTQLFANNTGEENAEAVSSTEFVQYLEDDRVEEYSIQPVGGVYEINGTFREGDGIETDANEEENSIPFFGDEDQSPAQTFTTRVLMNESVVNDVYELTLTNNVEMESVEEPTTSIWTNLLITFLPFLVMGGFIYYMMRRAGQGGGGGGGRGVMNFGKSQAKEADPETSNVRFSDVAGANEEKQELVEIVEFLKEPRRFNQLGARIPAGVLLEGPPGTGKTLLAKAVAGESGVPFYSISGSEFVEMFVGVGASRVRDLFENAKKNSPSIIFIDEIDAVGRQRGAGMGGGHDEREQTLNQLLTEMDGFEGNEGVIVMAASNRSDVLDPALLRPGRFDRRIRVGRPDVKGREAILRVHARDKPLSDDVNLKLTARQTPGFSGADLENLLNEAALIAARRDSKIIEPIDMDEAHDRVIAGPAKKDRIMNETERKMIAYHEAGHTIAGLVLSDARIVHKVTIVPRGRAGGYAIMLPREDRYLMTEKDLTEQIVGLLGGRAAEELFFGAQSSGASNDFQQATKLARSMVTEYGMSERLGPVQYEDNSQVFMGRDMGQSSAYSERTAYMIDEEILRILNEGHERVREIIEGHASQLKIIAEHLLEYETLNEIEIKSLFEDGEMPDRNGDATEYPREDDEDDEQIGTSYEAIKKAHEERVEELEEQHEDQKAGRATIGLSDEDEDEVEEMEEDVKTDKEPEEVDVDDLESDEDSEDDSDDSDDEDNEETSDDSNSESNSDDNNEENDDETH